MYVVHNNTHTDLLMKNVCKQPHMTDALSLQTQLHAFSLHKSNASYLRYTRVKRVICHLITSLLYEL